MNSCNIEIKVVTLAYFSGTGCTKAVADCFESQLNELGLQVHKTNIATSDNDVILENDTDLLIIFSPVYAFRLAAIVEKWTKKLPHSNGTYVAIISVSGGGEVSPNTACRITCKDILSRKKYILLYEKMIVMPSNYATQANQQLNLAFIKVLPIKVQSILEDIVSGQKNILRPQLRDRAFAFLGRAEHLGASVFGAMLHTSNACNQCGMCVRNCPKNNIRMENGKIKFGFRCLWCMKCIYSCPCKAIKPRILKFAVLKSGFDINKMMTMTLKESTPLQNCYEKDLLWQGSINYLKEIK